MKIGDVVRWKAHDGKTISEGKLCSIEPDNTAILYVSDDTGGFHVGVSLENILGVAGQLAFEEISKPRRYNKVGTLECWDVILDQEMDFLEGSVLKYLWRHKEKNGPHDLKKAAEYLNKMIKDYDKLYK
jgi:hypothetical protein